MIAAHSNPERQVSGRILMREQQASSAIAGLLARTTRVDDAVTWPVNRATPSDSVGIPTELTYMPGMPILVRQVGTLYARATTMEARLASGAAGDTLNHKRAFAATPNMAQLKWTTLRPLPLMSATVTCGDAASTLLTTRNEDGTPRVPCMVFTPRAVREFMLHAVWGAFDGENDGPVRAVPSDVRSDHEQISFGDLTYDGGNLRYEVPDPELTHAWATRTPNTFWLRLPEDHPSLQHHK